MKNLTLIFIFLFLFGCATKKQNIKEVVITTTSTTTTTITEETISENDILLVYNKLIASIKQRDFAGIESCYAPDAGFIYDEKTSSKYKCFNGEKKVFGVENILSQYKYMFKNRLLDNIEFEVVKIFNTKEIPKIKFINAWQNSDDDLIEEIEFVKIGKLYFIKTHFIQKKK
ncbi:MAG: hypothetical protein A2086_10240 [Spirochaetes bacterium GWD1_27_9]|nr:MAG: hypothetical protein A2Y34_09190 [Spirochaetes bacterium GWC1_27_15]OHD43265.1 MAG: hypothetical protein A2086_10240 [Spirochaetes bacterium GWD1_27_9]